MATLLGPESGAVKTFRGAAELTVFGTARAETEGEKPREKSGEKRQQEVARERRQGEQAELVEVCETLHGQNHTITVTAGEEPKSTNDMPGRLRAQ